MVPSHQDCVAVLEETTELALSDPPVSGDSLQRLEFLLTSCFQDDEAGSHFRSTTCCGGGVTAVSIADFDTCAVAPQTNCNLHLADNKVHLPIQLQRTAFGARKELRANTMKHAQESVKFMLGHAVKEFHCDNKDIEFFMQAPPSQKWLNCIVLGKVERSKTRTANPPSLSDLQHRVLKSLECSVAQKLAHPQAKFFTVESATAWKNAGVGNKIDCDRFFIKSCSEFPAYLRDLLGASQHLDELAGVEVGNPHPEAEKRFQAMCDQAPPRHVEGIDLKLGKSNSEIGGTVLAPHQCLSPRFLACCTVDHDSMCSYMKDERSQHKKERKIRVASIDHVDTKPTWLQFGETSNIYLYLSQKASAAEEKWLFIVNFVMNTLVDMVNSRVKAQHGGQGRQLELMRKRDHRVAVGSASNPLEGNFGRHQDGKNGIVICGDAKCSSHQLMVPTLCLQNHAHANTKIQWAPVDDPRFTAGAVTQECVLIHIQLLNVNEAFEHWVGYVPVVRSALFSCPFSFFKTHSCELH